MVELPPDLARLGDDLAAAARRSAAARARRHRFTVAASVGAVAFAVLTPGALGPALREVTFAGAAARVAPPGCDQPRGARFTMAACERPKILDRPAAWPTYS